jgi:hypothetical protein
VAVFEVRADPRYEVLGVTGGALNEPWRSLLDFGSHEPRTEWKAPPLETVDPAQPRPDIWRVDGSGSFAFNDRARAVLAGDLSKAGQLLPAKYSNEELSLFNPLRVVDCLDPANSTFVGSSEIPNKRAFLPDRFPDSSLFLVPETGQTIYCLENPQQDSLRFRARVDRADLRGLLFILVWDELRGPAAPVSMLDIASLLEPVAAVATTMPMEPGPADDFRDLAVDWSASPQTDPSRDAPGFDLSELNGRRYLTRALDSTLPPRERASAARRLAMFQTLSREILETSADPTLPVEVAEALGEQCVLLLRREGLTTPEILARLSGPARAAAEMFAAG